MLLKASGTASNEGGLTASAGQWSNTWTGTIPDNPFNPNAQQRLTNDPAFNGKLQSDLPVPPAPGSESVNGLLPVPNPGPGLRITPQPHTINTPPINFNYPSVNTGINPKTFLPGGIVPIHFIPRCAADPNSISGPTGFGPQSFIPASLTLPYRIDFANEPTATGPAQIVTVSQQLDPHLDLNTFQFGTIGFGNLSVTVPPGLISFSTRIDATASVGVFVDITANLNLQTGLVTWTFTSIDPTTLDVPAGNAALEGFLPPDTHPPLGEGFVTYTIQPKAADATGTVINAQAAIVFDSNAPINTAQITNTIDAGPGISSVSPLPATTTASTFTLNWSGQDDREDRASLPTKFTSPRMEGPLPCYSRLQPRPPPPSRAKTAIPTASSAWQRTMSATSRRFHASPGEHHDELPPHRHDRGRVQSAQHRGQQPDDCV